VEISSELVIKAYLSGIFPMGNPDGSVSWYSPEQRCIFEFDRFRASKRLLRKYRQHHFEIKINQNFPQIIRLCSRREGLLGLEPKIPPSSIWINESIERIYLELHALGLAHSVEVFYQGQLAGGLYGVSLNAAFFGESMFHLETDASKIALIYLVEHLKERGFLLLDCQYKTDHLMKFGASLVSRQEYLEKLEQAISVKRQFI
jgi:leucyl/phenylalanyl-tRNA--protein transferase